MSPCIERHLNQLLAPVIPARKGSRAPPLEVSTVQLVTDAQLQHQCDGRHPLKEGRETSMLYLLRFLDDHTSRGQSDKRTSPMEVDTDALELTYVEILSLDFAENLLAAT